MANPVCACSLKVKGTTASGEYTGKAIVLLIVLTVYIAILRNYLMDCCYDLVGGSLASLFRLVD